jgi:hypothetical protein
VITFLAEFFLEETGAPFSSKKNLVETDKNRFQFRRSGNSPKCRAALGKPVEAELGPRQTAQPATEKCQKHKHLYIKI